MLIRDTRSHWVSLLFAYKGSALPRIKYRLLAVLVLSVLNTYLQERGWWEVRLTVTPFTLVGLALGIFLGFRNNTSYDRFWEGRKLWGRLVNTTRTFSRQILAFLPGDPGCEGGCTALQRQQVHRIIAYVHAFRDSLRRGVDVDGLGHWLERADVEAIRHHLNKPSAILLLISASLKRAHEQGHLREYPFVELERGLLELTDIQGGCERIKNTPIPHSYTILIHRIVALYVFALPFGLVETLHLLTPFVVLIVAYTFLGLDAVGDEIEDPFGEDTNDLPLSTLARMIEINLRQAIGEQEVPAPMQPVRGVLS